MQLNISADSGGLGPYYEIIHQRVYAPTPDFIPQPGQCIVDVGANIGVYSIWARKHVGTSGTVVSIEPHPKTFIRLRENLLLNEYSDVLLFQCGCSDSDGELPLHHDVLEPTMASFVEYGNGSVINTSVRRLDNLTQDAGLKQIDILKIDVEGWELRALQGARETLSRVKKVVVEVDGTSQAVRVSAYLEGEGFRPVHRLDGLWKRAELQILSFTRL